ncbi:MULTISPECIES: hypothetical protein [Burkholderia]|uniref:Uncharacterized protein n=2 Tax=Burkholderia cepacia complex TaxID=87882 RepID=A0A8A8D6I4_9BURK|nr:MULTISPECIES: hypothetical protein [Burkholderia]MBU9371915.1 hypothetical protein [Burkholderia multivorans]NBJ20682.1 hypothetical protein [Burkholderia thailandensis]QTO20318.1 hypothetical protein DT99_001305 [Burkholderia seminalis]
MIMTVGEETVGDDDYDVWFQEQVRRGLREADDPKTEWVSHDQVKADIASQRAALQRRIEGTGGDYTRCGTPLVYTGRLELQPDILTESCEQKKPDREAPPST